MIWAADSTGNPVAVKTAGAVSIAFDGGAPVSLPKAVIGNDLPYAVYPLPQPVVASATATVTAPAGWLTTGTGSIAAATFAAENLTGTPSLLPVLEPAPRKMKVGWNTVLGSYGGMPIQVYANMMKGASGWMDNPPTDADGNPLGTDQWGRCVCILTQLTGCPVDPKGYPSAPLGRYTVMWDGAGNAWLDGINNTTIAEVTSLARITGGKDNVRVYDVALKDDSSNAPTLWFNTQVGCTNLRAYGPGVATDGSQQFHPEYLRMLAGARSLRAMQPINPSGNAVEYADFTRTTARNFANPTRTEKVPLASVGPYTGATPYYPDNRITVLVTTAQPHGFVNGQFIWLSSPDGKPMTLTLADGGTIDANGLWSLIFVTSPTQFVMGAYHGSHTDVTSTSTAGGTAWLSVGTGQPPEDHVALCNAVGADCWLNVPHTMSDRGYRDLAAMVARTLKPGLKCRVELSNEHWNWYQSQWIYFMQIAQSRGESLQAAYASEVARIHDLFAEVFTAAGRPADLIRVYGSQAVSSGVTEQMVAWCRDHGKVIDEIALAPYYQNGPNPSGDASAWDTLTPGQILDLGELWMLHGDGARRCIEAHYAALKPAFPDAHVVCYEGGPCYGQIAGSTDAIKTRQSVAWWAHPRQRGILLYYLKQLEDGGCTILNSYGISYPFNSESAGSIYTGYVGWNMQAGTGDGSDGQFDNRTDLYQIGKIVSPMARGMSDWIAAEEKA